MNQSIQYSIYFIWISVFILFLVKVIRNSLKRKVTTNSFQKGFDPKDKGKEVFQYICELIFSRRTQDFDINRATLTLELIHTNQKSVKTKLSTLNLDFKDIQIKRNIYCQTKVHGFFMIHRHKPLPPITCVRGVHHWIKDSQIFFEGFEIIDQMSGERDFYSVQNIILNTDMKEASVHNIKPQKMLFCSKQTFCPDFHSLDLEKYGQPIETPPNCPEEIHGIRLLPKLHWFEVFIFNAFLIHLTFALMSGILYYFNETNDTTNSIVAVLGSGLVSPTVVQMISYSYRSVVKTNYNSECSPMKQELHKSSTFWRIFRSIYLLTFVLLTVLLSILAITLITEDLKLNYKEGEESAKKDAEILIFLFCISIVIVYTLWLTLFSVIRFLFRLMFFKPKTVPSDLETHKDKNDETKDSIHSDHQNYTVQPQPQPQKDSQSSKDKETVDEKSERSVSVRGTSHKSSYRSEKSKRSEKSTEDDKKYSEMSRDDELNTGSVIVKPTKSLGYIDPKMFKLSESKIEVTKEKDKPKDKPKDNTSDKKK